jgi:hypothetical protein
MSALRAPRHAACAAAYIASLERAFTGLLTSSILQNKDRNNTWKIKKSEQKAPSFTCAFLSAAASRFLLRINSSNAHSNTSTPAAADLSGKSGVPANNWTAV